MHMSYISQQSKFTDVGITRQKKRNIPFAYYAKSSFHAIVTQSTSSHQKNLLVRSLSLYPDFAENSKNEYCVVILLKILCRNNVMLIAIAVSEVLTSMTTDQLLQKLKTDLIFPSLLQLSPMMTLI